MNFFNDEIHQDMVNMYRDFAQGVCGPIAAELDEEEKFPVETFKQAEGVDLRSDRMAMQRLREAMPRNAV